MTDLQTAKSKLSGHTLCLCRDGECLFSNERGIAPMLNFINSNVNLQGYSVADLIVGKAVAMLFVFSGIRQVYARTLSQGGKRIFEKYGVPFEYGTLTDRIINRAGTDVCPMEKAVADVDGLEQAYIILNNKLK